MVQGLHCADATRPPGTRREPHGTAAENYAGYEYTLPTDEYVELGDLSKTLSFQTDAATKDKGHADEDVMGSLLADAMELVAQHDPLDYERLQRILFGLDEEQLRRVIQIYNDRFAPAHDEEKDGFLGNGMNGESTSLDSGHGAQRVCAETTTPLFRLDARAELEGLVADDDEYFEQGFGSQEVEGGASHFKDFDGFDEGPPKFDFGSIPSSPCSTASSAGTAGFDARAMKFESRPGDPPDLDQIYDSDWTKEFDNPASDELPHASFAACGGLQMAARAVLRILMLVVSRVCASIAALGGQPREKTIPSSTRRRREGRQSRLLLRQRGRRPHAQASPLPRQPPKRPPLRELAPGRTTGGTAAGSGSEWQPAKLVATSLDVYGDDCRGGFDVGEGLRPPARSNDLKEELDLNSQGLLGTLRFGKASNLP